MCNKDSAKIKDIRIKFISKVYQNHLFFFSASTVVEMEKL